MSAPPPILPPGWSMQWDQNAGRNVYVESATGRVSWNPPQVGSPQRVPPINRAVNHQARMSMPPMQVPPAMRGFSPNLVPSPAPPAGSPAGPASPGPPPLQQQQPPSGAMPPPTATSRRRAYPTAHLAASSVSYTGGTYDSGTMSSAGTAGGYPGGGGQQPPGVAPNVPQLFTPGAPDVVGAQGAAPSAYGAQQAPQQQQQMGGYGAGVNGQQAHQQLQPPQQHQHAVGGSVSYGAAGVPGLTSQFQGMGMGGGAAGGMGGLAQKNPLYTVNLAGTQPNVNDLHRAPPEIRLPPNACITTNPRANADPSYQRCTLNVIPTTHSLLNKSKIPLGLIMAPYRSVRESEGEEPVPVVSDTVIARCRRCRTYINPYVQFIENGNRWKCCMCNISNEVPQLFDWDQEKNQPADRWQRPELNHSVVEFIAPREYMVRPPQPPVYIFLIDVGHAAVSSGMVATAARTILETLDRLPNEDNRTKISVIAIDTSLHFFCLPPGSTEPEMLVVSDLDDVFLPKPNDLLVNLTECRAGVEALLSKLADMFKDNHVVGSALGAGLQAAYKLASPTGGKIMTLTASLPSVGPGALKHRDDPKLLGTAKESSLLTAASTFYKTFPIDCSRSQVSVDMWLFASSYTDVATLACLPRYTGGQTYFYPAFHAGRAEDALKFSHEFSEVLASPISFEAVLRMRCTKGIRATGFHGNFFVRSTDLLALPAVPLDQSYAFECEIEEAISAPFVVFQSVVLHSTAYGERRIRVINLALPTTTSLSEVYAGADQVAIAQLLANKAVERSIHHRLEDARDALMNKLVDIFGTFKSTMTSAGSGASPQLAIASNMALLPLLTLSLLKHVGIRASAQIPPDLRAYAQALLTTLPTQALVPYLHPNFYALHSMPAEAGTEDAATGKVVLPPRLNLTSQFLDSHGLYLLDDGFNVLLWIGRDAVPQLCRDWWGVDSVAQIPAGKATVPELADSSLNVRVRRLLESVRTSRRGVYRPTTYVIPDDGREPSLRMWFLSMLVEDRTADQQLPSYAQFLGMLRDRINT